MSNNIKINITSSDPRHNYAIARLVRDALKGIELSTVDIPEHAEGFCDTSRGIQQGRLMGENPPIHIDTDQPLAPCPPPTPPTGLSSYDQAVAAGLIAEDKVVEPPVIPGMSNGPIPEPAPMSEDKNSIFHEAVAKPMLDAIAPEVKLLMPDKHDVRSIPIKGVRGSDMVPNLHDVIKNHPGVCFIKETRKAKEGRIMSPKIHYYYLCYSEIIPDMEKAMHEDDVGQVQALLRSAALICLKGSTDRYDPESNFRMAPLSDTDIDYIDNNYKELLLASRHDIQGIDMIWWQFSLCVKDADDLEKLEESKRG